MKVEPTLTCRAFLPLVSGLRALGHDPTPLLAAVGVDATWLDDPDARVPMRAGVEMLVRAAAATSDDCIGLHLAERADLRTVDVHFYAMAASSTLRSAFERLRRYQRLIHETARIELSESAAGMTLRHVLPGGLAAPRQTAEFLLAAWIRTGRLVTDTDWSPLEVRFAHRCPADTREHERVFRAPVRFETGVNAVVIGLDTLALPCRGADPALAALLDRYASERMSPEAAAPPSAADRVRETIESELGEGEPSAARVAARLRMSVRTLSRTLAAEGTTYRALLDQVRFELASRYLSDPRASIGEVAFRLGFSELSAFSRAFRRRTGQSPAAYKAASSAPRGQHSR